jgi:hypothetical protein
MKPSKSQSRRRNRQLIAVFAERAVAKNDRGVAEHGGGLQFKNTLPEIMDETFDLVNYLVEHEEQGGEAGQSGAGVSRSSQCF